MADAAVQPANLNFATVSDAVALAQSGQTIHLPAGAVTWPGANTQYHDGVVNSGTPTTLTSATANFVANDIGKSITGDGIPALTKIQGRFSATSVLLSLAATAGSGKNFTIVSRTPALFVNQDIQIIGAGMDEGVETPRDSNATIITMQYGQFINAVYTGSENVSRISGIVFELTVPSAPYLLQLGGRAYRRRNSSGNVVGGMRVDHLRFRTTSQTVSQSAKMVNWGANIPLGGKGSYVTGSFDHNFWDFNGLSGSEVNSFQDGGAPPLETYGDGWGQWNWQQLYLYGGGHDSELAVTYVEDNIFHRLGNNFGTTNSGGSRFVVRYNTSWGGLSGHGVDGGNLGPVSWEYYNNWFDDRGSPSGAFIAIRGGSHVHFNNRYTSTINSPIGGQAYRPYSATSHVFGPGTGRNFFDENWRVDPLTTTLINTGQTSTIASVPASQNYPIAKPDQPDERLGSVYAFGTCTLVNGGAFTLGPTPGVAGSGLSSPVANRWAGFTVVNTSAAGSGVTGDQGSNGTLNGGNWYGYIDSNPVSSPVGGTTTVVNTRWTLNTYHLTMAVGDLWEIRRVKTYFCNPGSGILAQNTAGVITLVKTSGLRNEEDSATGSNQGGFYFQQAKVFPNAGTVNKYWCNQVAFGHWDGGGNLRKTSRSTNWSTNGIAVGVSNDLTMPGGPSNVGVPTNRRNDRDPSGTAYPTLTGVAATTELKRIGAHWQAPGNDSLNNNLPYAEGIDGDAAGTFVPPTFAAAATYPNGLVTPEVLLPKISSDNSLIAISGENIAPAFVLAVQNFSAGTIAYTKVGTFPGTVALSSAGVITGTPSGAAADYEVVITATNATPNPDEVAVQDPFTLHVTTRPTIAFSSPSNNATFNEGATVNLQSNIVVAGGGVVVTQIDYYYGTAPNLTLIKSITDPGSGTPAPYTYQWTPTAGSYALTAKVTDSNTLTGTSSPAVNITVSSALVLSAPTIVVSAGLPVGGGPPPVGVGIAANYPGDVGIGSDVNVIMADDFQAYTVPADMVSGGKWSSVQNIANGQMRIATEAGTFFSGAKGLEMMLPTATSELTIAAVRNLSPVQDLIFIRWYQKWAANYNFDIGTSNHNGARTSCRYPGPGITPPADGSGFYVFLMQHNVEGALQQNEFRPGYGNLYVYWPSQRSDTGDHWYPTGNVIPFGAGDWLLNPSQYPDFVVRQNFQPQRDQWYCYEMMVKANTIGQNNGQVKVWVDGNLVMDFPNLFLRNDATMGMDTVHLVLHSTKSPQVNKKWYDNVVIAKAYIGPMT